MSPFWINIAGRLSGLFGSAILEISLNQIISELIYGINYHSDSINNHR